jgi:hypothetical protein
MAAKPSAADEFGVSVSCFGDRIVIGARQVNGLSGLDQGSTYVFARKGSSWVQEAELLATEAEAGDNFGYSVGVSEDTVVVGSVHADGPGGENQGRVLVFIRGSDTWMQHAKLIASDANAYARFGNSVSISRETVAVGAYLHHGPAGPNQGAAYVFVKPSFGWADMSETARLLPSDSAANDLFGVSVSVSGDMVAVGCPWCDDPDGPDQGCVYLFAKPESGWSNMSETMKLRASDAAAGDLFGYSVALLGDTLVVGAVLEDGAAGVSTKVRLMCLHETVPTGLRRPN